MAHVRACRPLPWEERSPGQARMFVYEIAVEDDIRAQMARAAASRLMPRTCECRGPTGLFMTSLYHVVERMTHEAEALRL